MFLSLQGEGTYIGVPSVFIRTSGCNMRCGWCFTPNAEVQTPDGKTKIENLSIGDEVLTIKESKLSTTTVTNKFVRQVSKDDVVRVVVGSNKVFVTKEHPFYVKDKGWVHAGELQVGDIIISATSSQLNSYRMKYSNPIFDENVAERAGSTYSRNYNRGKFTLVRTPEQIETYRTRMLTDNPMKDPEVVKRQCENTFRQQSTLEIKYQKFFDANELDIDYIGNNLLAVGNKESGYRFPDFIIKGTNKLIEIFDTTMQYSSKSRGKYYRDNKWKRDTKEHYSEFGYECIFLTEKELKNKPFLLDCIQLYKFNGKTVKSVSSLSQKQIIRLEGKKSNTVTVVNLETEDHTFLCYGCLVHNCDTPFTSWWDESKKMSPKEIYEELIYEYDWVRHVVITGGEPLIQKDLKELIRLLKIENHFVTIETNGTIFKPEIRPHLFSISPKLANSIPSVYNKPPGDLNVEKAAERHKDALGKLKKSLEKYASLADYDGEIEVQFKFVVQSDNDLEEIETLKDECYIPDELIYLMPEGFTKELQQQRSEEVAEICKRKKWIFCPRLQINLWGNKRGV